uniref:Stress-response A/B barrel domain-containing protein n=1 Tax=Physcomitrium patens TaxID=3218 RepID=A0A7I4FDU4_PHYPA
MEKMSGRAKEKDWSKQLRCGHGANPDSNHTMALSAAAQLANFVPNSVLQSISNSRHLSGSPSWAHILVRRFTHMSLEGRVVERMPEGVTHAFFQRFPSFEALEQYMDHPARLQVAEKYINPYCKGRIVADFEAEVEDDLEPLFRRGERFQQGIEHVVLIKVREGAILDGTEGMIEAFNALPQQIGPSVIVQLTAGTNLSDRNKGYTHGVLVRVPSEEALTTFSKHPAYVRVFTEKVLPISSGLLSADFLVDPVTKSSPL